MIDDEAVKSIENLHRLKNDGVLSEAEFEAAKQRILFGATVARSAAPVVAFTGELPARDDHVGWATLALRRFGDFAGRSSRKEFWMFQLIPIALFVVGALFVATLGTDRYGDRNAFGSVTLGTLALALVGLAVPQVSAEVRRFHDQGRSGWFAAINFVPYVGPFIVLVFMLIDGTPGENSYGPDPKAP